MAMTPHATALCCSQSAACWLVASGSSFADRSPHPPARAPCRALGPLRGQLTIANFGRWQPGARHQPNNEAPALERLRPADGVGPVRGGVNDREEMLARMLRLPPREASREAQDRDQAGRDFCQRVRRIVKGLPQQQHLPLRGHGAALLGHEPPDRLREARLVDAGGQPRVRKRPRRCGRQRGHGRAGNGSPQRPWSSRSSGCEAAKGRLRRRQQGGRGHHHSQRQAGPSFACEGPRLAVSREGVRHWVLRRVERRSPGRHSQRGGGGTA
mmetsp:Transcript_134169/g.373930  ORF Transcript_134169/g.373930 Transcript_134169/m.373930 type:complete len:270 (-) Transcript_134169:8-817(-)